MNEKTNKAGATSGQNVPKSPKSKFRHKSQQEQTAASKLRMEKRGEKLEKAKASGAVAMAMDVDSAGLPFLAAQGGDAGPKSVEAMTKIIREAGVPSELSNSAGTYVCNHLLYCVLHHAGPGVRAGFIHVPCIPEQTEGTDRPSLPLAQLVTALEAAVSACCKG